jgi:hypothetical protein
MINIPLHTLKLFKPDYNVDKINIGEKLLNAIKCSAFSGIEILSGREVKKKGCLRYLIQPFLFVY